VRAALAGEDVRFAVQDAQLGTGHALQCAEAELGGCDELLVLPGDAPLLLTATLAALIEEHRARQAAATVLTFRAADPSGYGRILRASDGTVSAIVEDREATAEQRRIDEVNSAVQAFRASDVLPLLPQLPRRSGGEIYLTDAVELLSRAGRRVAGRLAAEHEALGINTQAQLQSAEETLRRRRLAELMEAGVTVVNAAAVEIHADVEVGPGTILRSFVALEGRTRVGARCDIGPHVRLRDVVLGEGCRVEGPLSVQATRVPAGGLLGPRS
jgi:bifunctional UDP-N-acetylglucosamine pyrophosphorylase/glucosamine-1-phosphate N-acetyltransferase